MPNAALGIDPPLVDVLVQDGYRRRNINLPEARFIIDARTFQGKERDIMFLSMVSAPNEVRAPLSRDIFAQQFNVAASRAKDRMYLVRSVGLEDLSVADRLRRT